MEVNSNRFHPGIIGVSRVINITLVHLCVWEREEETHENMQENTINKWLTIIESKIITFT